MTLTNPEGRAEPRLAATVLLVRDDPFEVLMVRRRRGGSFSNALVFPGGKSKKYDADAAWLPHLAGAEPLDEEQRARESGAFRETFEEASILIGLPPGRITPPADPPDDDLRSRRSRKREAVLDLDAAASLRSLDHPGTSSRAASTRTSSSAQCPTGSWRSRTTTRPSVSSGSPPPAAVARAEAGEQSILFPTLMNLRRLTESADVESALAAADQREIVPVLPVLQAHPDGFRRDDRSGGRLRQRRPRHPGPDDTHLTRSSGELARSRAGRAASGRAASPWRP